MIVLTYIGSQCTKFHTAGWICWFLCPFVWVMSGSMWFHDVCDKGTAIKFCTNLGRNTMETLAMNRQAFGEWKHELYMESPNSPRPKKTTGEEQSKEHARHFLWHQGNCSQRICPGRPNSQFHVLLWRFMTIAWKFILSFGDKSGCCIMTTHRLTLPFSPGNFLPKMTWLLSPTHPTFLVLWLKIKLKGRHFETTAVIKTPSQNTTSRMHLRMAEALGMVLTHFESDGG
jgi:hypothetical protein